MATLMMACTISHLTLSHGMLDKALVNIGLARLIVDGEVVVSHFSKLK